MHLDHDCCGYEKDHYVSDRDLRDCETFRHECDHELAKTQQRIKLFSSKTKYLTIKVTPFMSLEIETSC